MICSTPRSGSSFLCELLNSTQLAGKPIEYFLFFKEKWRSENAHLFPEIDTDMKPKFFFDQVRKRGMTENGCFGIKLMWESYIQATNFLRTKEENENLSRFELINKTYPDLKFIYIARRSKIRQAVSFAKAETIGAYNSNQYEKLNIDNAWKNKVKEKYDFELIFSLYKQLIQEELTWITFFVDNKVDVKTIYYEDLVKNPNACIQEIFDYIGLDASQINNVNAGLKKESDEINEDWVKKFSKDIQVQSYIIESE